MISVQLVGDREIIARFNKMPSKLHDRLLARISGLSAELEAHVKKNKLHGQVLNKITGRLMGSINNKVIDNGETIIGMVYSGTTCNYAAIHEYGGRIRTRLGTGKTPPKRGGKAYAIMPERSFLRSSLEDYKGKIIEGINKAVKQAVGDK